ncbi:MAG: NAD(P)/FAD-dependent oxidoreductase [Anaerolineae bacterium]
MSNTYDVIIIGAGIMGCSAALQLARRGVKVALLEKGNVGDGSTGKSSAIIRQHYSNELTARMALHSLRVFQNFEETVGGESGFTTTGFVALVDAKDLEGLRQNIRLQQSLGIQTQLISPADLADLVPGMDVADLVAVAYEPESGYADPYLTVTSFAQAAKREGVKLFQDAEVTAVHFEHGRVTGVTANNQPFHAPIVLNSAGPWGARVAQMAGIEVPINPCRVQVSFFRRPPAHKAIHPVVADFIHATYFRNETGDLTLVGLIDPEEANAIVNPDDFRQAVDDEFVLESGERFIRRYPPMAASQVTGGYAALYAITPDWHAIVDELIPDSGFYICAGFSGHGFKLGPAVGVMAADMLTKVSDPEFSHHLFRLNRYAQDDPVKGLYEYSIVG